MPVTKEDIQAEINKNMIDIKGKKYLPTQRRIIIFRKLYPDYDLRTELIYSDEKTAVYKASVISDTGVVRFTAHGSATNPNNPKISWDGRFHEKAETAADGRVLGKLLHYFDMDDLMDDSDHLSDAPTTYAGEVVRVLKKKNKQERIFYVFTLNSNEVVNSYADSLEMTANIANVLTDLAIGEELELSATIEYTKSDNVNVGTRLF